MKPLREGEFGTAWSEPNEEQIHELLSRSRQMPWRFVIDWLRSIHPKFVTRLEREWLSDWTLLLRPSGRGRALDVGCGFGTVTLGLARQFAYVAGVDVLPMRLAVAAIRARPQGEAIQFVQADGRMLPWRSGSFDLVLLNGVLEWAGVEASKAPANAQRELLSEVRRVIGDGGLVAVAIENRFALETWNLTPDTHTGMWLVPLLPRWLGRAVYRMRFGRRLPVQLHSHRGYRTLFRGAGFPMVRLLDIAPSYNDYDFVVDPGDSASYSFLWQHRLPRSFNAASRSIRARAARIFPRFLGRVSYAYLVLAGDRVLTLLDAEHPIWAALQPSGVSPGQHRFACRGRDVGSFTIVVHDGDRIETILEIGSRLSDDTGFVPEVLRKLALPGEFSSRVRIAFDGTRIQAWVRGNQLTDSNRSLSPEEAEANRLRHNRVSPQPRSA